MNPGDDCMLTASAGLKRLISNMLSVLWMARAYSSLIEPT